MALLEVILPSPRKSSVGVVVFDATIREVHTKSATVTSHPVAQGSMASDHIISRPRTYEVQGIVTNHPIFPVSGSLAPSPLSTDTTSTNERAELAYSELERVMDAKELVSVVTTFKNYDDMAILDIGVVRDAATGNVMNATIKLQHLVKVTVETVAAPEPVASTNKKSKKKGKRPKRAPEPVVDTAATETSSLLSGLLGG